MPVMQSVVNLRLFKAIGNYIYILHAEREENKRQKMFCELIVIA